MNNLVVLTDLAVWIVGLVDGYGRWLKDLISEYFIIVFSWIRLVEALHPLHLNFFEQIPN
jgi:uncharacterized membrane protein (DUF2068 family)